MGGLGVGLGVNDVPIVGEPLAFGAGFIALLVAAFSTVVGGYFHTFAHEGGHLLALVALAQKITGFWINEQGPNKGETRGGSGWLQFVIVAVAGYLSPPLLGLAGAALISAGNTWAVLLAAIVFSILALLAARNPLAFAIPLLLILGLGAALLRGSVETQAFAATFAVWFLLITGTVEAFALPSNGGDAANLAKKTLIPGVLWKLLWIFVAVVSLIVGGQLLLRPGYEIG